MVDSFKSHCHYHRLGTGLDDEVGQLIKITAMCLIIIYLCPGNGLDDLVQISVVVWYSGNILSSCGGCQHF